MRITNLFVFLQATPDDDSLRRRRRIWRDFLVGLCLSAVLAVFWYCFEKTDAGDGIRRLTYEHLQRQLPPAQQAPITLIDISELERKNEITPRDSLKTLLTALKVYHPTVIGIDIDFSPEISAEHRAGQFISPDDPDFFAFCHESRNAGLPIYLGIFRTVAFPRSAWLGLPEYSDLAAAIIAPDDPRSMPVSIGAKEAPTMSTALAEVYAKKADSERSWLFERVSKVELGKEEIRESLVDYGTLQRLKDRGISIGREAFSKPGILSGILQTRRSDIEGKMLLVGDVPLNDDAFNNPAGRGSVSGILLHASAAYTATSSPLYSLREPFLILADFLIAATLMCVILIVRLTSRPDLNDEKFQFSLSWFLALLVIVFGGFVAKTRVLWDGFIIVALALFLHPYADRWFEKYTRWLHTPSTRPEQETSH